MLLFVLWWSFCGNLCLHGREKSILISCQYIDYFNHLTYFLTEMYAFVICVTLSLLKNRYQFILLATLTMDVEEEAQDKYVTLQIMIVVFGL